MNQSRPLQELEVIDQGPVSSNGLSPDTAEPTQQVGPFQIGDVPPAFMKKRAG
jgi:hypothetical protein